MPENANKAIKNSKIENDDIYKLQEEESVLNNLQEEETLLNDLQEEESILNDSKEDITSTIKGYIHQMDTINILLILSVPFILYLIIYRYQIIKNRNLENVKLSKMIYIICGLLVLFKILRKFTYGHSSKSTHLYLLGFILLNIKNIMIMIGY